MAKTGIELANDMQRKGIVTRDNKEEFLRRHGIDKFYEFDGGDLVDKDDMSTTTVRVNNNGAQEDWLLDRIAELGKWKRPDPALQKLKDAGWSDERIAAAEQGIKEKHPGVNPKNEYWGFDGELPEDWDDYSTDNRLTFYESQFPNDDNLKFKNRILEEYRQRMVEELKAMGIDPSKMRKK